MITKFIGNDHIEDVSVGFGKLAVDAYSTDLSASALATETATASAIKDYVDIMVDGSLKAPEAYDPTATSNYPLTYGGEAIQAGDSFRIAVAGTMGGVTVNVEDLLIALVDGAGAAVDADWMVAESNRDQATETVQGVAEIATQAEVQAETDDLRIVTPLKLAAYIASTQKTVQYTNELHTTTNTGSGSVLYTLSNLGTHGTDAVIDVCVFYDGQRITLGVDYTLDSATGAITTLSNVPAGRQLVVDYKSQNA